jgi:hypothetical protein
VLLPDDGWLGLVAALLVLVSVLFRIRRKRRARRKREPRHVPLQRGAALVPRGGDGHRNEGRLEVQINQVEAGTLRHILDIPLAVIVHEGTMGSFRAVSAVSAVAVPDLFRHRTTHPPACVGAATVSSRPLGNFAFTACQ